MQRKTRAATGAETPHAAIAAYDGLGAWSRWAAASLPTVKNQPASSEAVHAGVHLAIGGHASSVAEAGKRLLEPKDRRSRRCGRATGSAAAGMRLEEESGRARLVRYVQRLPDLKLRSAIRRATFFSATDSGCTGMMAGDRRGFSDGRAPGSPARTG